MDSEIAQMVKRRREALYGVDDGRRPWGLALSGGGIRSATFCLGLLKALARQRLLLRFDLLSTVSGGGYVGSVLGQLCNQARDANGVRAVESGFANADRLRFGSWLRANGRYLIPGGLRDMAFAVALYLRNLLGTHIELAIAALLIGLPLALINLLAWEAMAATAPVANGSPDAVQAVIAFSTRWPTVWMALVLPWGMSILLAQAYWSVRDRQTWLQWGLLMAMWCAAFGVVLHFRRWIAVQSGAPGWLVPVALAFAGGWILSLLFVAVFNRDPKRVGALRNRLTDELSRMLVLTAVIVLLGLLDWTAWWFAAHTSDTRVSWGGWLLALAAMARAVLPLLFSSKREAPGVGRQLLMTLASVLGLLAAFALAAWWIGVLYATVLLPVFVEERGLDFGRGWGWLALIGGGTLGYALLTGWQFSFLNLSSLHMFYKARIVRGYLGATNAARVGGDVLAPQSGLTPPSVPVGRVDGRDDVAMHAYVPHRHGGPVHFINVCINQTHDPRQRLFNRDRKSLPLTIAPEGWMQAAGAEWAQARGEGAMTLGSWVAVSGAAFAPGLGRLTRRGLAALSVFAGLRLGYWWDSRRAGITQDAARAFHWYRNLLGKTRFLLLECFGSFPGSGSRQWYLSDGGHFENTGAYALLRQEAVLIVIADCGADPQYRFCDLESLIRRARIDLHADIEFLRPRADAEHGINGVFGSLNDLASSNSQACLALAEVRYASGRTGRIVVVKPNVSASLPVDLVNFKADNPVFPQQSTTDQFFNEAQWESYYRLGEEIGRQLRPEVLNRLAAGTMELFEADDGLGARPIAHNARSARNTREGQESKEKIATAQAAEALAGASAAASRLQARVLHTGAVTATLGLGTAATLAFAAWQGLEGWRTQTHEQERADAAAIKDLTDRWSKLRVNASSGDAAASLAGELLRTGDLLCQGKRDNFMARFSLSVRIVHDARQACQRELEQAGLMGSDERFVSPDAVRRELAAPDEGASPRPFGTMPVPPASRACLRLMSQDNGIECLQYRRPPTCAPRYWARDYSGATGARFNCSVPAVGKDPAWVVVGKRLSAPFALMFKDMEDGKVDVAAAQPSPAASAAPTVQAPIASAKESADRSRALCSGRIIYVQIHGPAHRETAYSARDAMRHLEIQVPGVEDVLATAQRAGRAPPRGFSQPTILADADARPCAESLAQTLRPQALQLDVRGWDVPDRQGRRRLAEGTLEIWFPRNAAGGG